MSGWPATWTSRAALQVANYARHSLYLLTPWSRVLLEKLTGFALIKKFPAFYGTTRKFITVLTSARHLSLSWANSIQSPQPLLTSSRSILILSSHLRLGLLNGLLPSGFPTKTLCTDIYFNKVKYFSHIWWLLFLPIQVQEISFS